MRVMHILSSSRFSGAENMVCQIIEMFKEDKQIEMLYCSPNGSISITLENNNIQYLPLKKISILNIRYAIHQFNPDLIHAHDIKASVYTCLAAPLGIPIISHLHGNHEDMKKLSIKSLLFSILKRRFAKIIVVSSSIKEDFFISSVLKDSEVISNITVEKTILNSLKSSDIIDRFDIIFLGRLSYPKDPIRMIKIVDIVRKKIENLSCVIVGDGELMEEVRDEISKRGLLNTIKVLGFIENPYQIINHSEIMIMTSRYEGTPMCALEAITLGLPIVSTPTDGILNIIDQGVTGFLSNSNEVLAEKITYLLLNKVTRDEFSKKAKEKSKAINNVVLYKKRLKNIYSECNMKFHNKAIIKGTKTRDD